jgi:hypothetical protein
MPCVKADLIFSLRIAEGWKLKTTFIFLVFLFSFLVFFFFLFFFSTCDHSVDQAASACLSS